MATGRIALHVHVWWTARSLPFTVKRCSLDRLLAGTTPLPGRMPYRGVSAHEIIDAVRESTKRPWRMGGRRCLREGLLAFRFLRLAGHPAVLHFAIEPDSVAADSPSAHCWVTVAGVCVINPPSPTMKLLFSWDGEFKTAGVQV